MNRKKLKKIAGLPNISAILSKISNDNEKNEVVVLFDALIDELSAFDKKVEHLDETIGEFKKKKDNLEKKDILELKELIKEKISAIKTEKVEIDLSKTNSILSLVKNAISNIEFPKTFFKEYLDKFLELLLIKDEEPYKEEAIKENKNKVVTEKIIRTPGKTIREKYEKQI